MPGPVLRSLLLLPIVLNRKTILFTLVLCLCFAPRAISADPSKAGAAPQDFPPAPVARAINENTRTPADLAASPRWLALLHQSRRRLDRSSREALSKSGFFLTQSGAPELELDALVAALHQSDPAEALEVRCRFPARHRFLANHGLIDSERGACPELDTWRAWIGDFELTLIFPEAFLGNPASMFGHTLLRFDPIDARRERASDGLLGWALDYSADDQGDVGALYLMRGLLGGYQGRFSLDPYYEKIKVYSDWQDRDIWEYPLSISPEDRELLLLHVWELRDVSLRYYFFTQNCSEMLLELLEVAEPGLGRGGGFPPVVAPVDTVRAIRNGSDSLGTPRLRESPATRLQEAMAGLSRRDALRVEAVARGNLAAVGAELEGLSASERARILELAYDLLRHRYLAGEIDDDTSRSRSRQLLLARSRLGAPTPSKAEESAPMRKAAKRPPDAGHGTARIELTGGFQDRDGFLELRIQPAYHSLLDAPGGFAEAGQIRVLDTRVRFFPKQETIRLHELVVLDVVTASPWRRPFRPLGWRFDLGLRTRLLSSGPGTGLDTESVFRAQGGLGAATAPLPRLLLYGFGELVLESGSGLEGDLAVGPVSRAGLTWSTPGERASFQLEGIAGLLTGPRTSPWLRAELSQRTSLAEKWSVVTSGRFERAYDVSHFEGRIGLVRYF